MVATQPPEDGGKQPLDVDGDAAGKGKTNKHGNMLIGTRAGNGVGGVGRHHRPQSEEGTDQ